MRKSALLRHVKSHRVFYSFFGASVAVAVYSFAGLTASSEIRRVAAFQFPWLLDFYYVSRDIFLGDLNGSKLRAKDSAVWGLTETD
ncbi:unnamed protein product [Soboliphyme baturini]|uniref:COX6C domain-containing protein n=1 Tax=Soboliphyme baturini TaxID=241478 RepID=A0A183IRD8_9BILA|nr:unnamed protein product [Soboliphyme baturini]